MRDRLAAAVRRAVDAQQAPRALKHLWAVAHDYKLRARRRRRGITPLFAAAAASRFSTLAAAAARGAAQHIVSDAPRGTRVECCESGWGAGWRCVRLAGASTRQQQLPAACWRCMYSHSIAHGCIRILLQAAVTVKTHTGMQASITGALGRSHASISSKK